MDVRLSSVQEALRESATAVIDRLGPRAVGQLDDLERSEKLEAAIVASGWRELRADEADGAPLTSAVEPAIVAEELGRGLADAPFLGPTLATELRRIAGAPPASAAETVLLARSLSDLAVAVDSTTPESAVAIDAEGAGTALLLLPGPGGFVVASVPLGPAVVGVDLTRPSAVVADASSATEIRRHGGPLARETLVRWHALGLALTSADLVGVMRGAIDLSCSYAASRRQFGRPVGSFQAVAAPPGRRVGADGGVSQCGPSRRVGG